MLRIHRSIPPSPATRARKFYRHALRGRPIESVERANVHETLWFVVGGKIVEVNPERGRFAAPIMLEVDDPDSVAQRCWDAGFTVRVQQDETGRAPVSVIDPFGRRVDLAPLADTSSSDLRVSKEQR